MPELPEVETIRRDLSELILGQKIVSANILSPKTASHSAAFFKKALVGRRIIALERRGKLLIFRLTTESSRSTSDIAALLVHLKMTGQLIYLSRDARIYGGHGQNADVSYPNRHTRAIFELSGGGRLFFNDLRKFGYLKLVKAEELEKILLENYGPEPLGRDFTWSFFRDLLKNKTANIKALLLDQKALAGLGNIYVDESLWAAHIRPARSAGSLKNEESKLLHAAIIKILKSAVKHRGTTFSDYRDSQGRKGNFSRFLRVYGRTGAPCYDCGGTIQKIKVTGRGTHYCPHCQK